MAWFCNSKYDLPVDLAFVAIVACIGVLLLEPSFGADPSGCGAALLAIAALRLGSALRLVCRAAHRDVRDKVHIAALDSDSRGTSSSAEAALCSASDLRGVVPICVDVREPVATHWSTDVGRPHPCSVAVEPSWSCELVEQLESVRLELFGHERRLRQKSRSYHAKVLRLAVRLVRAQRKIVAAADTVRLARLSGSHASGAVAASAATCEVEPEPEDSVAATSSGPTDAGAASGTTSGAGDGAEVKLVVQPSAGATPDACCRVEVPAPSKLPAELSKADVIASITRLAADNPDIKDLVKSRLGAFAVLGSGPVPPKLVPSEDTAGASTSAADSVLEKINALSADNSGLRTGLAVSTKELAEARSEVKDLQYRLSSNMSLEQELKSLCSKLEASELRARMAEEDAHTRRLAAVASQVYQADLKGTALVVEWAVDDHRPGLRASDPFVHHLRVALDGRSAALRIGHAPADWRENLQQLLTHRYGSVEPALLRLSVRSSPCESFLGLLWPCPP